MCCSLVKIASSSSFCFEFKGRVWMNSEETKQCETLIERCGDKDSAWCCMLPCLCIQVGEQTFDANCNQTAQRRDTARAHFEHDAFGPHKEPVIDKIRYYSCFVFIEFSHANSILFRNRVYKFQVLPNVTVALHAIRNILVCVIMRCQQEHGSVW